MSYAPFHIGYDGGQRLFLGTDESLVMELEALGGGLDPDPPWNFGGPLLLQREASATRILGWIRGTTGRSNAWEAWGIVISAAIDLTCWPWHAALLEEPDHNALWTFGDRVVERVIPMAESLPPYVAEHVTTAYADDRGASTVRIKISRPDEARVMPWLWLLGPKEPSTATIGPPRVLRAIVRRPLAYEPLIEETRLGLAKSRYIDDVISLIQRGHRDVALNAITALRAVPQNRIRDSLSANVADLAAPSSQAWVTQVEAEPEKEKDVVGISTPPPNVPAPKSQRDDKTSEGPSPWRALMLPNDALVLRANIIIGLLGAVLAVVTYGTFHGGRTNNPAEKPTAETSTAAPATTTTTAGTDTATATAATVTSSMATSGQTASCDMKDSADRKAVLEQFAAYAQTQSNVSSKFAQLMTEASTQWSAGNKERVAIAARQLFLRERCGSGLRLDGLAGPSTTNADCSLPDWSAFKTNNDAALSWLCQRFRS